MKPLELMEQGRFLGEEFLLWLWMRAMTEGGTSGEEGDVSGLFVDDAIQLVSERGEVKQISLAKGNPSECREAFEALSRGMRPAKMKIRLLSGDLEWVATLDAAQLRLSALKLPPSTGKAPHERLHDRLFLLEEGIGHLERRFNRFLQERVEDDGEALAQALLGWVKAGLEGAAMPSGDAPWEQPGPAPSVGRLAVSVVQDAAQGAAKDPAVRKAMGKLMKGLAEHGTTMTVSTPGGPEVTITPEAAARAAKRLGGAP